MTVERRWSVLWRYQPRLVGLAVRRGASRDNAEDLATSAILRCAASGGVKEYRRDMWPYLATTLVNLMVDEHRRMLREACRPYHLPYQRSIEESVVARDAAGRVLRRLLQTEASETAAMVYHHAVNQVTWEELGHQFGLSASAARFRVRRAIERLKAWARRHLE